MSEALRVLPEESTNELSTENQVIIFFSSQSDSLAPDDIARLVKETLEMVANIKKVKPDALVSVEVIAKGVLESYGLNKEVERLFGLYNEYLDRFGNPPSKRINYRDFKKDVKSYLKSKAAQKGAVDESSGYLQSHKTIPFLLKSIELNLRPGIKLREGEIVTSVDKNCHVYTRPSTGARSPFSIAIQDSEI